MVLQRDGKRKYVVTGRGNGRICPPREIQAAIQRLQCHEATRNYDLSGTSQGDDVAEVARAATSEALEREQAAATAENQEVSPGNATPAMISVKQLSMRYFQKNRPNTLI